MAPNAPRTHDDSLLSAAGDRATVRALVYESSYGLDDATFIVWRTDGGLDRLRVSTAFGPLTIGDTEDLTVP